MEGEEGGRQSWKEANGEDIKASKTAAVIAVIAIEPSLLFEAELPPPSNGRKERRKKKGEKG